MRDEFIFDITRFLVFAWMLGGDYENALQVTLWSELFSKIKHVVKGIFCIDLPIASLRYVVIYNDLCVIVIRLCLIMLEYHLKVTTIANWTEICWSPRWPVSLLGLSSAWLRPSIILYLFHPEWIVFIIIIYWLELEEILFNISIQVFELGWMYIVNFCRSARELKVRSRKWRKELL